jgi:hypothetical protein
MRRGPERTVGWRSEIGDNGRRILIEARHRVQRRPPKPNELMKQTAHGRPWQLVETLEFEWAIIAERRLVATMRQHPSGQFFVGPIVARARNISDATVEILKHLRPRTPST